MAAILAGGAEGGARRRLLPSAAASRIPLIPRFTYIFDARLVGISGVSRKLAIRSDQTLADLHDVLRAAFDWDDDHLYAFWRGDAFWPRTGTEYVHPFMLEEAPPMPAFGPQPTQKSAEVRLDRLRLARGDRLSYVFDFGDEWRVALRLHAVRAVDDEPYPRVLERRGTAPPQYGHAGEEDAA
jgi:hypothetical protein